MSEETLERDIDEIGRYKVFAKVRSLGWPMGSDVPRYVWETVVAELKYGLNTEGGER